MAKGTIVPYRVYTVDDAADILKVNKKTIYELQDASRLPKNKIGKGYRFLGEDLINCMRNTNIVDLAQRNENTKDR